MKPLKLLTVLLAISGVVALVIAMRTHAQSARPLTPLAAIQPSMNYAYVRVEGVITQYPIVDDQRSTVSFQLNDTDGGFSSLRVSAYGSAARDLLAAHRLPLPGQRISLEGTLRVRDEQPSLVLNTAEALQVNESPVNEIDLNGLEAVGIGERVSTLGQVRQIREIGEGLHLITLRSNAATTTLLLPLNLAEQMGQWPTLKMGDWISVTASVGEFRDARQLLPSAANAIVKIAAPKADVRHIDSLGRNLVGQWVSIKGNVSDLRPFQQGMRVMVQEGNSEAITVVLFDSEWDQVPMSQTMQIGDAIGISGELSEYRRELEVVPEIAQDVWRP